MLLSPVLGKDKTVEHLLPLFVRLLKDEACLGAQCSSLAHPRTEL